MSAENISRISIENESKEVIKKYLKEITLLKESLIEEERKRNEVQKVIQQVLKKLEVYYNKADLLQYGNLDRSSVISFLTGDVRGSGVLKVLKEVITNLEEVNSF